MDPRKHRLIHCEAKLRMKRPERTVFIASAICLTFFIACGGGTYTDPLAGEMVYVKGGTFTMGCTPEQQNECDEDESPARQVKLDNFYIGKYEVTQARIGNISCIFFSGLQYRYF